MEQREASSLKHFVDKCITFYSVLSLMALIIKLKTRDRAHRLRITEQEIKMFLGDLIVMCLPLLAARNEEKID